MTLGRNILWNLLGFAWLSILLIAVTPFMVKRLGVEAFGVWSVLVAVLVALNAADLGIGSALVRFLAAAGEGGRPRAGEAYLRSGALILCGVGLVAGAAFLSAAPWIVNRVMTVPEPLRAEALAAFRVSAAAVFLMFPLAAYAAVPAAARRFDLVAARNVVFHTAFNVLLVAGLLGGGGLVVAATAHVVGTVLMFFFLVAACRRLMPGVALLPAFDRGATRELIAFVRHKSGAQVAASVLQQADRFVIGAVLPVAQVAFYAVPVRVSQRVLQVAEHVSFPFYPTLAAHLAAGRRGELADHYRKGMRTVAVLAFGAVAVLGGLARPILAVWIGPEFADAGTWPLRILLVAHAAGALFMLPTAAADAAGRPGIPAAFLTLGAALHIPLLLLGTRAFGIAGAAAAVAAGYAVPLLLGTWLIHRRVDALPGMLSLMRSVIGVLGASLAALVVALLLAAGGHPDRSVGFLLLSVLVPAAVYAAGLVLFGGVRRDDLDALRRSLRR